MGVAIDGEDVLGAGRLENLAQRLLCHRDVAAVVLALGVIHACNRDAVAVGDSSRDRDAVLWERQQLRQRAQRVPVVVVAHVLTQRLAPVTVGQHVLRPLDR